MEYQTGQVVALQKQYAEGAVSREQLERQESLLGKMTVRLSPQPAQKPAFKQRSSNLLHMLSSGKREIFMLDHARYSAQMLRCPSKALSTDKQSSSHYKAANDGVLRLKVHLCQHSMIP